MELCHSDHHGEEDKLRLWLHNKTVEQVTSWLDRRMNCCVTALSPADEVVGFALMDENGEILLCYVAPEVVGQGYGRALLQALEQDARSHKLSQLHLESTRTAKGFYEHHGYKQSGQGVEAFGGMVGYPMSKPING